MALTGTALLFAMTQGSYWFAGILTIGAAAIVTMVMLITSRSEDDADT